jgi:ribonuclease HII
MAPRKNPLEAIPSDWLPAGLDPATARIAGADEVGRGALAGPLVMAMAVLPPDWIPVGLKDSKLMTPDARERVARELLERAEIWIEEVPPALIDRLGIGKANELGFARLIERAKADFNLIDGTLKVPSEHPYLSITKGERFAPVAAASVVAKWYRDTVMAAMAQAIPDRGFEDSGYPTPRNIEVIRRFGRTPWHRTTFRIASLGEKDAA